jgi:hypothetical protein
MDDKRQAFETIFESRGPNTDRSLRWRRARERLPRRLRICAQVATLGRVMDLTYPSPDRVGAGDPTAVCQRARQHAHHHPGSSGPAHTPAPHHSGAASPGFRWPGLFLALTNMSKQRGACPLLRGRAARQILSGC